MTFMRTFLKHLSFPYDKRDRAKNISKILNVKSNSKDVLHKNRSYKIIQPNKPKIFSSHFYEKSTNQPTHSADVE
jgi:hypothetical protein